MIIRIILVTIIRIVMKYKKLKDKLREVQDELREVRRMLENGTRKNYIRNESNK